MRGGGRVRLAALACGLALLVVFFYSRVQRPQQAQPPPTSPPGPFESARPRAVAAPSAGPAAPPAVARNDASSANHELTALGDGLASANPFERIAALDRAAGRGVTEALPLLERIDLTREPDIAPIVVRTLAKLADGAGTSERGRAIATLERWLESESRRTESAPDARGNVSALVEALGAIRSPLAVDALTRALDRQNLPLHVETVAVQGLTELGDSRALPAVERFGARVAARSDAVGFEAELREEAAAAARAARTRLGS
jgi:hypothetical protein